MLLINSLILINIITPLRPSIDPIEQNGIRKCLFICTISEQEEKENIRRRMTVEEKGIENGECADLLEMSKEPKLTKDLKITDTNKDYLLRILQ